jgi:hypothetical protein
VTISAIVLPASFTRLPPALTFSTESLINCLLWFSAELLVEIPNHQYTDRGFTIGRGADYLPCSRRQSRAMSTWSRVRIFCSCLHRCHGRLPDTCIEQTLGHAFVVGAGPAPVRAKRPR